MFKFSRGTEADDTLMDGPVPADQAPARLRPVIVQACKVSDVC